MNRLGLGPIGKLGLTVLIATGLTALALILAGQGLAAGNPELTLGMTVTNSGNSHESLHQSPFSNTNAGAIPNDFMQYVMLLENKSATDQANNVVITANLPTQTVGSDKAVNYVLGSAGVSGTGVDIGTTSIKYFNSSDAEITPSSIDALGRDPNVAKIKYMIEKVPAGTMDSANKAVFAQFSVRMIPTLPADTQVSGINANSTVTSSEIAGPVTSNTVSVRMSTKPEFDATGDVFRVQPGPAEFADKWTNTTEIGVNETAFLGMWIRNFWHNTTAKNVVVETTWSKDCQSEFTLTTTFKADNAAIVSDTAVIKSKSGLAKLELVDGAGTKLLDYNQNVIGGGSAIDGGVKIPAGDLLGGNANIKLGNATVKLVSCGTTPTPTPTPTPGCTSCSQTQTQSQSQTVTINQQVLGIKELPKTGVGSMFGLATLLSGIPAGVWLKKSKSSQVKKIAREFANKKSEGQKLSTFELADNRKRVKSRKTN